MAMDDQVQASPPSTSFDAKVEAEVNAPATVTLYDDDGLSMSVPEGDVNAWLAKGFKRERWDIRAKTNELKFMFGSAAQAVDAFVESVLANGQLNTAAGKELDVAHTAFAELRDGWVQLMATIGQKYPVLQALTEEAAEVAEEPHQ